MKINTIVEKPKFFVQNPEGLMIKNKRGMANNTGI
jgi:hypothetical protein